LIRDAVGVVITDARSLWTMAAIGVIVHKLRGLAKQKVLREGPLHLPQSKSTVSRR